MTWVRARTSTGRKGAFSNCSAPDIAGYTLIRKDGGLGGGWVLESPKKLLEIFT